MSIQNERELDSLFSSYRETLPDMDGSAEFMPKLWQAIEARQRFGLLSWKRWTNAFVSVSLAICLLFTLVEIAVNRQPAPSAASYVEVLDDDSSAETLAYAHVSGQPDEEPGR